VIALNSLKFVFKNLRRRYKNRVFGVFACVCAYAFALTALARAPELHTVRDVELTYAQEKLVALAWTRADGWRTLEVLQDSELRTLCELGGRSWLSWNRAHVITLIAARESALIVRDPVTCAEQSRIAITPAPRDADVHLGRDRIALAQRGPDGLQLHLYALDGTHIARLGRIANAELGFSPDGTVIFNLDHGAGPTLAWDAATGARRRFPQLDRSDLHFSADAAAVFATTPGVVARYAWPIAKSGNSEAIDVQPGEVLRGTSTRGNSLLLQAPNARDPKMPTVRLFDSARNRSRVLASGHIDATALNAQGTQAAVAVRDPHRSVVRILVWNEPDLFTP
jgi:hypothetical protein